jgi:hypothetical protein
MGRDKAAVKGSGVDLLQAPEPEEQHCTDNLRSRSHSQVMRKALCQYEQNCH